MTQAAHHQNLSVATTEGTVVGVDQGTTAAWYGIPYAQPPVGPLRYRRAVAPEPRDRRLAADAWGAPPVQPPMPEEFGGIGEAGDACEDCLTLNIVRPADSTGPLPVMVWIYGGAFSIGAARNYDPATLVEHGDVVFVSMNYRVGPLGFLDLSSLSTPQRPIDTNVGFYDQIRALSWIQQNIAGFGGDADNVTIFGESAGAMSVLSLLAMPDAAGLFHKAIAQSPAPGHANSAQSQAHWARTFAENLGAARGDAARALDAASPAELLAAADTLTAQVAAEAPGTLVFGPCLDGASLPAAPLDALAAGAAAAVPLLIGTNDNEGLLFMFGAQRSGAETIPVRPATLDRVLPPGPERDALLRAYPGYPEDRTAAQLGGDMVFWYPTTAAAAAHSTHAPTWAYRFDYVSADPRFGALGATHGQEIAHVLGWSYGSDPALSGAMMGAWAAFAHTGDPNGEAVAGDPESAPAAVAWPRYDADERSTLIFDAAPHVEADPRASRRRAWQDYSAAIG